MAKIAAKGAVVKSGSAATPTTSLTQVKSVSLTIGAREMLGATTHDSATTKDYLASPLRDTNGVEIELIYDPSDATHEAVRAAHAAGTLWYFTLVLPDAGTAQWAMSGYITDFSVPSLDPETGVVTSTLSYKANAVDTFTQ